MPVCGMIVTFTDDEMARRDAEEVWASDPRFELGESVGNRRCIVTDTLDISDEQDVFRAIEAHPSVSFVEIAFHDFSDVTDFGTGDRYSRRRRLEVAQ